MNEGASKMAIPLKDTEHLLELTALKKRVAELETSGNSLLCENKYLRELYERSPLGYQSLDENGCLIEINQAWLETLGYDKQEVIGKNFGDFLVAEWKDQFIENFPKLKAIGEILGFEFEMCKKDGSNLIVRLDGRVGKNDQGGFQQTYCIIQDITKRKKAEEERKNLQAQLLHSQKIDSVGRLAGGIAHDFNNILSSVIGYAEMALDDELPEDSPGRDSVQAILQAGMRAKDLVKQILAFSRQTKLEKRAICLGPIVTEAMNLLRASLPVSIEIKLNISSENTQIFGEPTQIHQVMMNLGTNAGSAMLETGGILDVVVSSIEFASEDLNRPFDLISGAYVEITVTDTGSGISSSIVEKIFDPFFSTKPKEEGTGLGLSVIHGIVKDHDGAIIVNSEMDKGTVFKVYFPQFTDSEERETSKSQSVSQLPRGNERVLLVDDEPTVGGITKKRLERLGYTVTMATSSQKALQIFTQDPDIFDLVLTDQTMPEFTGDQLAQRILSLRPGIPLILCTGFSHRINREQAKEMGFSDFLMKPIAHLDLAKAIRRVLAIKI